LARADLVLYDYLVNPLLLQHVPPAAERICLGQARLGREMPPEEIHARMIRAAAQGQTVVRLKAGDPNIFGRGVEEAAALAAAGIPFEVVPAVTAAMAATAYAGIPLTHGEHCSAVAFVTGHERPGKAGPPLDYGPLAQFPGTLVFYMGMTTAAQWSTALLAHGKSPATPVAIVRRVTWSDQQTVRTTLGEVTQVIQSQHLRPPAVVIVGEAVSLEVPVTWFTGRPLFGWHVLVTRPQQQVEKLSQRLAELGAEVVLQPAIEIGPPADWGPVDAALAHLDRYDWLVFSSSNGVAALLDRLLQTGYDLRALGPIKLAAIGSGTAEELARYHLRADLVPREYRAEALAAALVAAAPGKRFLLARASRGREVLGEQLAAAGGRVEQVVAYRSTDVASPRGEVLQMLQAGRIDWITVTSSAIARSLVQLFGADLRKARLASISPVTSDVLRQLGYPPAVEAVPYTMEGVAEAITSARGELPSSDKPG
jgi:uroporphyrinogen III methyltransferase/synthase